MERNKLRIGCSAYATPSWQTLFYPEDLPKSKWFEYYCQNFNTYEFNSSFYRFPVTENLLTWHNKTPEDFQFSIKVPKIITHIKRLENCEDEIAKFYLVTKEGLKNKLACILWQLPPSFNFTEERLKSIIDVIDPNFKNIVEFRHLSWWNNDVIEELNKNNITFCTVNYPGLPESIQQTTSIGYVRMHGNPKLFYSEYSQNEIKNLYEEINNQGFDEAYVYFNNTASTAGIINALQFKELHNNLH